jgi:16S rRNA (guanine1207-N2)-methyltransferase
MSAEAIRALVLPFEEGLLRMPEMGRGFLLRAEASPVLSGIWRERLICEQTFKPEADRLLAAGHTVVQRLDGQHDAGLCLLTKHKTENFANIARAWTHLAPGGVLVCAGATNIGSGSIEKAVLQALGGLGGTLSKFRCRVFWIFKPTTPEPAVPPAWLEADRLGPNVEGKFLTKPGIFSWEKVDVGSRLLAEHWPGTIGGTVADLGAGWGYLSVRLLERFPAIQSIDLFEAELLALEAARANLAARRLEARAAFHWHDVTAGLPTSRSYDWIVMNPPFHSARAADFDLGRAFITAASQALRSTGGLVLVANRQLPYESQIFGAFASLRTLAEDQGFKVLLAHQPLDIG